MKPQKIREIVLGKDIDPLKGETRHSLALVALLAWIGLGTDGVSLSAVGLEEVFRSLGEHAHPGLYMALATAVAASIIAIAYHQVIELFPTGGGAYRVATKLLGPYMGLVAGCALVLDYVLMIAISVAAGVDVLMSLLPLWLQDAKLGVEVLFIGILIVLNMRGMKVTAKFLMSIILGCALTYFVLIVCVMWAPESSLPLPGATLDTTPFRTIVESMDLGSALANQVVLGIVLACETGLLFVAANAGFLGGPSVLSKMAADSWVPHKFRYLSTRLVTQSGILVFGIAALTILFGTRGNVTLLVVLYSVSVLLTLAIALFGLCLNWWQHRRELDHWKRRFALSLAGFVICAGILCVLLVEKFNEGGWAAAVIIAAIAALCIYIRQHYRDTKKAIASVDQVFANQPFGAYVGAVDPSPEAQTAIFVVGTSRGGGLHALLWVQRMFPGHFKNFIFVNARTVDTHAYGGEGAVEQMRAEANATLKYFVDFCHSHNMASAAYIGFGTDVVKEVTRLCSVINDDYPNGIFFTSKLIFEHDNWFSRLLHNQAALAIQRRLHLDGLQMVILPMKV